LKNARLRSSLARFLLSEAIRLKIRFSLTSLIPFCILGLRHKKQKNLKKWKIHMKFYFLRFNMTWSQKLLASFTKFYSIFFLFAPNILII
jgi:hypothetical protein